MRTLVLCAFFIMAGVCYAEDGVNMAPDGTFVYGTPTLAPDGTFVGGHPTMAPDGTFVGDGQ